MAIINFTGVSRWNVPTQTYIAYSPGTTTDLSISTLFNFAGPITGTPIKFRFYPINSASTTIFLIVNGELQSLSFTFTANTWNEITFNSNQNTILGANNNLSIELVGYTSPIVYTIGTNIIHIQTTDTSLPTSDTVATIKYWDGSSWTNGIVKFYDGSAWVNGTTKIWDGTTWVNTQ